MLADLIKRVAPLASIFWERDDRRKVIHARQADLKRYAPEGDEWWELEEEDRRHNGDQQQIVDEIRKQISEYNQVAKARGLPLFKWSVEELLLALKPQSSKSSKTKPTPVTELGLALEAERRAERQRQLELKHQAKAGFGSAGTFSGTFALSPGAESGATIPSSSKKPNKKPKIRSPFRQQVLSYLIDHRGASAKNVCEWCDRNEIRGPKTWYTGPSDRRSLVVIYNSNLVIKGRIDKYVSDVHKYIEKYL